MKKSGLFISLLAASLIQCGTSDENTASQQTAPNYVEDSLLVQVDDEVVKVVTLKELLNCIDSSATSNGGALACLLANKDFLAARSPEDIELIYFTYWETMNAYLDVNLPYIEEKHLDDSYQVKAEFEKSLNKRGFYVEADGEGGYFPMVDRAVLFTIFDGLGNEALQAYISFFRTQRDFIAFDGGLALSPLEIAKRVAFFDKQYEQYPTFIFREEMLRFYEREMYFVMFGLDNTPAFDFGVNTLNEEHKKALEYLMKNATPFTKEVVKKYYTALESAGWHMLDEGYNKYFFGIGNARKGK
jgi:hypothetical protein